MQLLSGVMLGLVNLKIREAAEAPINIKLAHCAYEKKTEKPTKNRITAKSYGRWNQSAFPWHIQKSLNLFCFR